MRLNKAVFLDRDGVLNKELGDYVCKLEDFHILEHNFMALKELQDKGYLLIVITNQGGLAKGWYSESTLAKMHEKLRETYQQHGVTFTEMYYCRHNPLYNGNCLCRKPGSIMLEKAIARFNVDKTKSYFIGDRERDVIAGQAAGVTGILIDSDQPISEVFHLIV
ncbi:D-glycero-alpha-D-manno-heptose-1,7-bisphosphate 7-phosphatase [Paradesertivirga mongoliensis]|uniref:D,D-heptose 1,7-bisphosphate phosphatase n=1 Tax=Paradesertivirga mongoliensis TaxID=2100740 RepID=A0ABW4ZRX7_9SPHI|nr:HAD family hydrolase [Pedobacter mongoliensis]